MIQFSIEKKAQPPNNNNNHDIMLTADIHPKGRAFADRVSEESDMPCICCIGNLSCFELFGLFFCKPTNKWIYMKLECFCHFSEYAREGGLRWYCFWLLLLACLPARLFICCTLSLCWLGYKTTFTQLSLSLISEFIFCEEEMSFQWKEGRQASPNQQGFRSDSSIGHQTNKKM